MRSGPCAGCAAQDITPSASPWRGRRCRPCAIRSQRGRHGGAESTHAGNNGDAGSGRRRGAAAPPSDFHGFYLARGVGPSPLVERPPASDGAVVAHCCRRARGADRAFEFRFRPFLHLPELEAAWFTVCQTLDTLSPGSCYERCTPPDHARYLLRPPRETGECPCLC